MKFSTQIVSAIIAGILLSGCMRTFTLRNGITKVPANSNVYKNKERFTPSLLSQIDTTVVYEEFSILYNKLCRLDNHLETEFYGVCRFYSNGCFNQFFLRRGNDDVHFDPAYNGERGVYYSNKNSISFDLWGTVNGWGWTGKYNGDITVNGDTLIINRKSPTEHTEMYIKRKILPWYLDYNANW